MNVIDFSLDSTNTPLELPSSVDILKMPHVKALKEPQLAIKDSLDHPINSETLDVIVKGKEKSADALSACIVISDNTRPVPYKGESGILYPIVERLITSGLQAKNILILVATGTHRALSEKELKGMLDLRLWDLGVEILNHDCHDTEGLSFLGKTTRGSDILINSRYIDSDIKILTGLVESHFMAGASGGRKSICPGLIGEQSTFIFHGAPMLADDRATALILEGNPCHEESLEMATTAGADFIVNVTLDHSFALTGIFSGDLVDAHKEAVEFLKSYTAVKVDKQYDIVLTHAGFVGINHYQAAKAGVEAAKIVKPNGYVLMVAENSDDDIIGSLAYRTVLQLLKLVGSEKFEKTILSEDWTFIPEQWQVQMWNRLFKIIPQDHFYYFSPQFKECDYRVCPGQSFSQLFEQNEASQSLALAKGLLSLSQKIGKPLSDLSVAFVSDGPYGAALYEG